MLIHTQLLICCSLSAISVVLCYGREAKDEETAGEEQMNFRTKIGQYCCAVCVLIVVIVIGMAVLMMLLSWHSHCESSVGSFDECRTAQSGRQSA